MAKKLKKLTKKYAAGGYNMSSVSQTRQNPYYLDKSIAEDAQSNFASTQRELTQAANTAMQNAKEQELARKQQEREFAKKAGVDLVKSLSKDLTTTALTDTTPTVLNTGLINPQTGQPLQMTMGKTTGGNQGVMFSKMSQSGAAPVAPSGGLMGSQMSNLAVAGIGAGATAAGMVTEKLTDDKSQYETSNKENTGNIVAEGFKGAGTGFTTGATLGSLFPGVGNVVGGIGGAIIGGGIGVYKGIKENRENQDLAEELQREQSARRAAFQNSYVQSRLTGADTGFGLNSSTNMNNQFTGSYLAKKGGIKPLPGGVEISLPGGAKKYIGQTHEEGGIQESSNVEVENNETKDKVEMKNGGKRDYFFSEYLKLGGKSFAKRHEEMVKSGASQKDIQDLATKQEEVAGRNPKKIARYGGLGKYAEGGAPCPEGYIMDEFGNCIPISDVMYYTQNPQTQPEVKVEDKPKGKRISQSDYDYYIRQKNNEQKIAAINDEKAKNEGAVTDQTVASKSDVTLPLDQSTQRLPGLNQITTSFREDQKKRLAEALAASDAYDAEKKKAMDANMSTSDGTVYPYNYDPFTGYYNDVRTSTNPENSTPVRILYKDGKPTGEIAYRENPEDIAAFHKAGFYKKKNPEGTTSDWRREGWDDEKGNWIDFKDNPAFAEKLGYDVPKNEAYDDEEFAKKLEEKRKADTERFASNTTTGGNTTNDNVTANSTVNTTTTGAGTVTQTGPNPGDASGYTDPKTTYITDEDLTQVPQTAEEKEAARLAGLPRYFMGFQRTVNPDTGEVTINKSRPLMGVGAMEGSRLGTTTGDEKALEGILTNRYDAAWENKSDALYAKKSTESGKLSYSDYIADRDKIAESNWGKKYGYKKGMSAEEAKVAHGKFEADVHSLFANNPEEILGYFKYIIDGGDPNNTSSYLGEDAKQIRDNLKTKGFIDKDGNIIAGKEEALSDYLEKQATNSAVGPIHNALGSYTAEGGAGKIKIEEKEKIEEKKPLEDRVTPCPPGMYRSTDGSCKPIPGFKQKGDINNSILAGLGQLLPVGYALMNPPKITPGVSSVGGVSGPLLPRMNLNQERASTIQGLTAMKNFIGSQNAGPGAIAALQAGLNNANTNMLKIAKQEQDANKQLAAEEGRLGLQASTSNIENEMRRQMFNKEARDNQIKDRYETILGAIDTAASRIAGIVKDDRAYKAQERLAKALDETGSYDRFTILEQLQRESKRKNSPYANMNDSELRRIAAALAKDLNPDLYVSSTKYKKFLEEEEKKEKKDKQEAKLGGVRQYVSRLGELNKVRSTKPKFNI